MGAVKKEDPGSDAGEPGTLKAYVYSLDRDQTAYATGRNVCIDKDTERITKPEEKPVWDSCELQNKGEKVIKKTAKMVKTKVKTTLTNLIH